MNERIKELAERVDKEFNSPYDRHKAIEKFAKLIVKECAGIADEETSLPYNSYSEKIKKHFGVEE